LSSFAGRQIRIHNSVQGPSGDIDKTRVLSHYLMHADRGNEIKVVLANFGSMPFLVQSGASIVQMSIMGMDNVSGVYSAFQMTELPSTSCLTEITSPGFMDASMALAAPATTAYSDYVDHYSNYKPKPYNKPWAGQQKAGGP
jgi:hypothetical protein